MDWKEYETYITRHFQRLFPGTSIQHNVRRKGLISKTMRQIDILIEGMRLVYAGDEGTARWYRMDSIPACGKTGTAQNPHGDNHSVFIAFAPVDHPKIAIAVVVENSGYGATWAAPIATLIMEKYLRGRITLKGSETRMLAADFIHKKK